MVKLYWNKGLQFIALDKETHKIVVDTNKESGGFEEGFTPIELLLVALAGCMSMDIVSILSKKGGKIEKFEVTIEGERNSEHPRRLKKIILNFRCVGDYKKEDLMRSFELSRDKYCSVLSTLKNPPDVEYQFK